MRILDCPDLGTHLSLPVSAAERSDLAGVLEAHGVLPGHSPLVVLAPGASYGSSKRWPVAHFAAVGDALAAAGARVILVGSSDEAELTRAVDGGMYAAAVDLAGALGLGALKALIEKTQVLIANDAGCRHIAAAFGVPSLIFFGSTSVEKTPLNLEAVRVFERTLECRPCYKRKCPRPGHPCLSEILPAPVSEAALQVLGDASQSFALPERS
jgi:heptosyltransferase-2